MRFSKVIVFVLLSLLCGDAFGQNFFQHPTYKKNSFFAYWGWNRASYTKSDIRFQGEDYDFTIYDVVAKDRQSPFSAKLYFSPTHLTIPQYNFRVGYFMSDHTYISLGTDHMKYVVQQGQDVVMDGFITHSGTAYDGYYEGDTIHIQPGFLEFEHTDGLNYVNVEMSRYDYLLDKRKFKIALTEGIGAGILYPRTDTKLLGKERYNEFHWAGLGISARLGLRVEFFKYFFIQPELKVGHISMPNIRTTASEADKATQKFNFFQANAVFGVQFFPFSSR